MNEYTNLMLKEFSFHLPEDLIAKHPVYPADACRLMRLNKEEKSISNNIFYELADLLKPGDLLIANDTGVEARRIFLRRDNDGKREEGARIEAVFLEKVSHEENENRWKVLIKKRKRLKNGEILQAEKNHNVKFEVIKDTDEKLYLKEPFEMKSNDFDKLGQMPIPPYMRREEDENDKRDYQNYFKKNYGSAAAPTAALHFTDNLVKNLNKKQIQIDYLTLHIGYGTFAPLKQENFQTGSLHEEYYHIPETLAKKLAAKQYNRIIAVGTTTLRALEHAHKITEGRYDDNLTGQTNIFIHPPEKIKSVDGLITNFHLPSSSLLLLTACIAEPDFLMKAYDKAIKENYRFYSYGDAMLIL